MKTLINQKERTEILSLYNPNSFEFIIENAPKFVKDSLIEFYSELQRQKQVHLFRLSLIEENKRIQYIKNNQLKDVSTLFLNKNKIVENYNNNFYKKLITESVIDFGNEIDRFNDFLFCSLCQDIGLINEGWFDDAKNWASQKWEQAKTVASDAGKALWDGTKWVAGKVWDGHKWVAQQVWDGTKWVANKVAEGLTYAVNYIKEKGLSAIMEGLRSALMSGVGTAIQIALSFTGVGAIANEIAWGIMTLYDGYQVFFNGGSGQSIMNLIIDIICLLTAGTIGKALGKFVGGTVVGTGAKAVSSAMGQFLKGGLGKILRPVVNVLSSGASKFASFLGKASTFMAEKMGIKWAAKAITGIKGFFDDVAKGMAEALGIGYEKVLHKGTEKYATGAASYVGAKVGTLGWKAIKQAGNLTKALGPKFEMKMLDDFIAQGEAEISKMIGKNITKGQIEAAKKYAEDYLKDKPIELALEIIDKKLGTPFADLFVVKTAYKKMGKAADAMLKGASKTADRTKNVLRGDLSGEGGKWIGYADKVKERTGKAFGLSPQPA